MNKHKRWHTGLIVLALILTLFNVLPTLFYYAKPLDAPVSEKQAWKISTEALNRSNTLADEGSDWLYSFCKLIGVKPEKIVFDSDRAELFSLSFKDEAAAQSFRKYLPKAGSLIDFYPATLTLSPGDDAARSPKTVLVARRIPTQFKAKEPSSVFSYIPFWESKGIPTKAFADLVAERVVSLGLALGGNSQTASLASLVIEMPADPRCEEVALLLASELLEIDNSVAAGTLKERLFSALTQGNFENKEESVNRLITKVAELQTTLSHKLRELPQKGENNLDTEEKKAFLESRFDTLNRLHALLIREKESFSSGSRPWTKVELEKMVQSARQMGGIWQISVGDKNPMVQSLLVDFQDQTIELLFQSEFKGAADPSRPLGNFLSQTLFSELARIDRETGEHFALGNESSKAPLITLENGSGALSFDVKGLAKSELSLLLKGLYDAWTPTSIDFQKENFPFVNSLDNETAKNPRLGLLFYAPILDKGPLVPGFRPHSIYVVAKGVNKIVDKLRVSGDQKSLALFREDFASLKTLLESYGARSYSGSTFPLPYAYKDDIIFEIPDYYRSVLMAFREDFHIYGNGSLALLELSTLRQRIEVENAIDNASQEALLKWRDEYRTASVDPRRTPQFEIPKPTKNPLWTNFVINVNKFFRGDDRKVLKWGLDLSGGKSVLLAMKDRDALVTNSEDLDVAINELTRRVNGMGLAEVSIRREGNFIALDFPGSASLSAKDLIEAASMEFQVVNETFSSPKSELSASTQTFLQEVWDEALVTGKTEPEELTRIAWNHLFGLGYDGEHVAPQSDAARALYEAGLRLAAPKESASLGFNDSISSIARLRGTSFAEWNGQSHPLLIVFQSNALKGSYLQNIRAFYDPKSGNALVFEVKSKAILPSGEVISPRESLYEWTSQFSKEAVSGTPKGEVTDQRGWRMAVILNGEVIASPALESPLRDGGMISGHFTQREIYKLKADLEAGSLSYTPEIISEMTITPELGLKERVRGVSATLIALVSLIAILLYFYRFAGVIAAVAVVFDLFLIWAFLQNLGASISLPGIAGVILTLGIAVDANVLVFERIREELAAGLRIGAAIQKGYERAFSAILDSNVTSLIAALILLQFDAGPVKAFALTLITGIVASLFTALFVTHHLFKMAVDKGSLKTLPMRTLVAKSNFPFIQRAPRFLLISGVLALAGALAITFSKSSMLGLDFTGGYRIEISVAESSHGSPREAVERALLDSGARSSDFAVKELGSPNHLKIYLSPKIATATSQGSQEMSGDGAKSAWLISTLKEQGVTLSESSLQKIDSSWESVSSQFSSLMRRQTLLGLTVALLAIFAYLAFRFDSRYAGAAIIGLFFDLVVTMAIVALLHLAGVPIAIDLNTVAALLTVIGFSLNDTVIVFDRIREEGRLGYKNAAVELVNKALNITLSRTLMTSGVTLTVLLILTIAGGPALFNFSSVMAIGITVGTLSSFFVSSYALTFLERKARLLSTSSKDA